MSSEVKYARKSYLFHKVSLLSINVAKTMAHFKTLLGTAVKEIPVPDERLRKRGIRWLQLPTGIQIHVIPPTPGKTRFLAQMKNIIDAENTSNMVDMPLKETHTGLRVPDLTPIVKRVQQMKFPYELKKRADGLYQLYLDIDSALDYFEIDSTHLKLSEVKFTPQAFENMVVTNNNRRYFGSNK